MIPLRRRLRLLPGPPAVASPAPPARSPPRRRRAARRRATGRLRRVDRGTGRQPRSGRHRPLRHPRHRPAAERLPPLRRRRGDADRVLQRDPRRRRRRADAGGRGERRPGDSGGGAGPGRSAPATWCSSTTTSRSRATATALLQQLCRRPRLPRAAGLHGGGRLRRQEGRDADQLDRRAGEAAPRPLRRPGAPRLRAAAHLGAEQPRPHAGRRPQPARQRPLQRARRRGSRVRQPGGEPGAACGVRRHRHPARLRAAAGPAGDVAALRRLAVLAVGLRAGRPPGDRDRRGADGQRADATARRHRQPHRLYAVPGGRAGSGHRLRRRRGAGRTAGDGPPSRPRGALRRHLGQRLHRPREQFRGHPALRCRRDRRYGADQRPQRRCARACRLRHPLLLLARLRPAAAARRRASRHPRRGDPARPEGAGPRQLLRHVAQTGSARWRWRVR